MIVTPGQPWQLYHVEGGRNPLRMTRWRKKEEEEKEEAEENKRGRRKWKRHSWNESQGQREEEERKKDRKRKKNKNKKSNNKKQKHLYFLTHIKWMKHPYVIDSFQPTSNTSFFLLLSLPLSFWTCTFYTSFSSSFFLFEHVHFICTLFYVVDF